MNFIEKHRAGLAVALGVLVLFGGFLWWRSHKTSTLEQSNVPAALANGRLATPVVFRGTSYWLPPSELYASGLTATDVPAVDAPKFTTVADADALLGDDLYGIDVEMEGVHRFYPVQILNWHVVINDEWQGKKFAVTYDPLTMSPAVYSREVQGTELHFEYAGKVFTNNAVLRDRETGTEWLQLNGEGIDGSLLSKGSEGELVLEKIPSTFMSWDVWKAHYPDGSVLSSETGYARDYTRHPYGSYDTSNTVYFPVARPDTQLDSKWRVDGVGDVVFSWKILSGKPVINDTANGTPVVGFWDNDFKIVRIFSRSVTSGLPAGGGDLTFTYDSSSKSIQDDQTHSIWNAEGLATSGTLKGTQLTMEAGQPCFWFAWAGIYPGSHVAGVEQVTK